MAPRMRGSFGGSYAAVDDTSGYTVMGWISIEL
jgi:hypothetical protein